MSDPNDFTPKEAYLISLYKTPDVMFSRSLRRHLMILVPAVGLAACVPITGEWTYGIVGFGLLLFGAIRRLVLVKRGLRTMHGIITKYEAKLKEQQKAA